MKKELELPLNSSDLEPADSVTSPLSSTGMVKVKPPIRSSTMLNIMESAIAGKTLGAMETKSKDLEFRVSSLEAKFSYLEKIKKQSNDTEEEVAYVHSIIKTAIQEQTLTMDEFKQRIRKFELEQGHIVRTAEQLDKMLNVLNEENVAARVSIDNNVLDVKTEADKRFGQLKAEQM